MTSTGKILLWITLFTLLALGTWWAVNLSGPDDDTVAAREQLDSILGQSDVPPSDVPFKVQPEPRAHENPLEFMNPEHAQPGHIERWMNDLMADNFGFNVERFQTDGGGAAIGQFDIRETPRAYRVEVALDSAADADNIQVDVERRRIRVHGTFTRRAGKDGPVVGTSMISRSMTTAVPVNPGAVTRELQEGRLVVTIPKQQASQSQLPPAESLPPSQPEPLSPELDELLPNSGEFI